MRVLTNDQTKAVEQIAVNNGMTFLRLMENAGSACARIIREIFSVDINTKATIICGSGKNGGDGFVISRKLYELGCTVNILLANGQPKDSDSNEMLKKIDTLPVNIFEYGINDKKSNNMINDADILIDAIFGTGFSGKTNEQISELFNCINRSSAKKVSIDIPSGLYCNSGDKSKESIEPDLTIALSSLKPVHILVPSSKYCGRLIVADIGISEMFYHQLNTDHIFTMNDHEVKQCFIPISLAANKGDFGHVLSVCGSKNMPGAAVIAANGAVTSGAGLVTAAFPDCAYAAISSKLTEPLLLPLESNNEGTISSLSITKILRASEKATAVLIGCGLGLNSETINVVMEIINKVECPIVLDADGINAICDDVNIIRRKKGKIVLTPHPGEMSRLTGLSVAEIQQNRILTAKEFSNEYGVTLVLKGANTIVAESNNNHVYINSTGNPGMAKGGSGDLLAGILASFIAQGMNIGDASRSAVYIHGLAADTAVKRLSYRGLTPTACIEEIQSVMSRFETVC